MARFKFRLATLLRLRESARDERRTLLAQAYRAEDVILREQQRLEAERAALEQRIRGAAGPGEIDVDRLIESQRFELVLRAQKEHLAHQRELVKAEIERRRQALVEANREVQVLENLREKQRERWRGEESRREVKRLDEVGQRRAIEEVH